MSLRPDYTGPGIILTMMIFPRSSFDNPYWVRYKNYEDDYRDRLLGYVSADYKFTDWLTFTARTAVDTYHDVQNERMAIGSTATSGFTTRQRNMVESNTDLMLKFNKNWSKISLNGLVGAHYPHPSAAENHRQHCRRTCGS